MNILARLLGETSRSAVLLTAHYDSVPAGPGAADDASGVAALLETARILASAPAARDPVIFLFSDGEEPGLLGAEAFMAEHRWAGDIGAVVNLEANGTRGQSILFETSENNGWLIDAFAAEAPRPVASSLFYEIYRNLPHSSDLTVYKRAGLPGVNFAFTEGGALYHTPLDNSANLDPASVQHHGDNALAAVRAFATRDLGAPPPGNAVFMDVLPGTVLRWPEPWTPGIAAACLVVWIGVAVRLVRLRETSLGELLMGWLVLPGSLVVASAAGYAVTFTLSRATGTLMPWYASPLPTRIALWTVALLCLAIVSLLIGGRARWWGAALGVWWWWAILSLVTAWMLPGASVIFLVLAAPALLALAVVAWSPLHASAGARAAAAFVGLFVASWFWLAFAISAETLGLAAEIGAFVASAAVLAASGMAPFFTVLGLRDRGAHHALGGLAVAAAVAYVAALQVPVYSAAAPQRLNVVHIEDGSAGEAYWALDGEFVSADGRADVPEVLTAAARFDEALVPLLPWSETRLLVSPAPTIDAPAPSVRVLDDRIVDGERALTITLLSPRRAEQLSLYVPEREGL